MLNIQKKLIRMGMVVAVSAPAVLGLQAAPASALSAAAQTASADPRADVKIDSRIWVERTADAKSGDATVTLVDPATVKVVPGDTLLFINAYRNTGAVPVTGFVVNNPVHAAVALIEVIEDWAVVSVDGGQTFGALSALRVPLAVDEDAATAESASRPAEAADVTHIRWVLPAPIAPGAAGELRFRGLVK